MNSPWQYGQPQQTHWYPGPPPGPVYWGQPGGPASPMYQTHPQMMAPSPMGFPAHPTQWPTPRAFQIGSLAQPKYPYLAPALGRDAIKANFRLPPHGGGVKPEVYNQWATSYVFNDRTPENLRIISKEMPWTCLVTTRVMQGYLTVLDIWYSVWETLQQPLTDGEWGTIAGNAEKRNKVTKAAAERVKLIPGDDPKLKRIDWLGEECAFRFLEKDEDFTRVRVLPGDKVDGQEVWMIQFGKP